MSRWVFLLGPLAPCNFYFSFPNQWPRPLVRIAGSSRYSRLLALIAGSHHVHSLYWIATIWILYGSRWRDPVSATSSTWRLSGAHWLLPWFINGCAGNVPAVDPGHQSRQHLPGKAVASTPGLVQRFCRAHRPLVVLSSSKLGYSYVLPFARVPVGLVQCEADLCNLNAWQSEGMSNYWCQGPLFDPFNWWAAHREKVAAANSPAS